jgi:hypothetical protein
MKMGNKVLFRHDLLFRLSQKKSMFSRLHSDIKSLKSGLVHLTGQPNSQEGGAKVC